MGDAKSWIFECFMEISSLYLSCTLRRFGSRTAIAVEYYGRSYYIGSSDRQSPNLNNYCYRCLLRKRCVLWGNKLLTEVSE